MEYFPSTQKRNHLLFNPTSSLTYYLKEEKEKDLINPETINYVVLIPKVTPRKRILFPNDNDLDFTFELITLSKAKLITFKLKRLEQVLNDRLSSSQFSFLPFSENHLSFHPFLIPPVHKKGIGIVDRWVSKNYISFFQGLEIKLTNFKLFVFDKAFPILPDQEILLESKLSSFDFVIPVTFLSSEENSFFESFLGKKYEYGKNKGEWLLLSER